MHLFHANVRWLAVLGAGLFATGCGSATRHASSPHGTTTTTAAEMEGGMRIDKVLIAEPHRVAMVARSGCVSTMRTSSEGRGDDELRVRCPKKDRIDRWMIAAAGVTGKMTLEPAPDDEDDPKLDRSQPFAKILLTSGKLMQITKSSDVARLTSEVRALDGELASAEQPAPGPASPSGWQMLHVTGPAHVLFAGAPARGVLEAKVSTSGQYLCEFVTGGNDGAMRATKSGWIPAKSAAHAIDEVLAPFNAAGGGEGSRSFAAGVQNGQEQKSNVASTGAVFERFAEVQEALGDACLPELEGPSPQAIGL
jgi:hypothetical protein